MCNRKSILFAVSEYGEFSNLLDLAERLHAALGIHAVFVFKADYGALERHRQIAEAKGFSWASERRMNELFDARSAPAQDDYIPSMRQVDGVTHREGRRLPVRQVNRSRRTERILIAAVGAPFYVGYYVLRRPLRRLHKLRTQLSGKILDRVANQVSRRIEFMIRIFQIFDPVLVISGQDYPLSITAIAAKVGEEHGVKTAIVPFSMTPTTKEVAESFAELGINRARSRMVRKIITYINPRWLHRYRGRYYTRLPLRDILASEITDLTPQEPWTPNSGRGIIMAPSQQSIDYCISAGIPVTNLRLTGALWNDQLLQKLPSRSSRRAYLIRDIGIFSDYWRYRRSNGHSSVIALGQHAGAPQEKKLVVVSWPPNQWPRKATGFETHEAFSRTLAEMLASIMHSGLANIAVSLHPTLIDTPSAETVRANGLYVLDADLVDVLDCADIFVATVSSTLLWSLQRGIPSINFDPYRYGYREFSQAGLAEAVNMQQLRVLLMTLLVDEEAYRAAEERLRTAREYWTMCDGKSGERILRAIEALML